MSVRNSLMVSFLRATILLIGMFLCSLIVKAEDIQATQPLAQDEEPYSHLKTDNVGLPVANSVLIALADNTSNGTVLKSELQKLGIPKVDIISVNNYTPPLTELSLYDVVVTWSNYPYRDKVAMGNVLADYVDKGHGVVLGNFVWYGPTFNLAGRIQDPGYSPFEQVGGSLYKTACLGKYQNHPIMAGVTAACDYYRDNVIVETGATLVASWNDGYPFVAANNNNKIVGITSYPGNNRAFTGDIALVYYNAINFVATNKTCLGLTCTINGKPSEAIIQGTNGDDIICGTDKADIILGKRGHDTICGGAGDDVILADNGHDRVDGGPGNDVLDGGTGMDMLDGGPDNDVLLGGNHGDLLYGGTGFDYLSGGLGRDMLNGGPDDDICEKENNNNLLVSCENLVSSTNMSVLTLDKDLVSPELANVLNMLKPEIAK